jgi:hypothetical protein
MTRFMKGAVVVAIAIGVVSLGLRFVGRVGSVA